MKIALSVFALALFMSGSSGVLLSHSSFAESPIAEEPSTAGDNVGEASTHSKDQSTDGDDVGESIDETEELNSGEPGVDQDVDGCTDCEIFYSTGGHPEVYQTSGGPDVQHTIGDAKPTGLPISFNLSGDEGDAFHEVMRKKRRAARAN